MDGKPKRVRSLQKHKCGGCQAAAAQTARMKHLMMLKAIRDEKNKNILFL